MMNLKSIPSHSPSVVTRKTGNEYVLVPVTNNIADMDSVYTLNETGAFIWEHIDGNRSLESIIEILISEYDTDTETAESDLLDFVNKMNEYLIIR
jgi:Coenzyme PQQ synthesis protein D (PqqD)